MCFLKKYQEKIWVFFLELGKAFLTMIQNPESIKLMFDKFNNFKWQ